MGIFQVISDGVLVCICKVYYDINKISTSHGFVYENDFSQEEMSEYCGAIIDSISHAPIFLLEDKYRKLH